MHSTRDTRAIRDHKARLASLLDLTKDFQHVLISCRTQFFSSSDEIPRETGMLRIGLTSAGQPKDYAFTKIYLTPFKIDQVKEYLRLVFPIWRLGQRKEARKIAERIPDLTMRPMLLAHIRDLLSSKADFSLSAEIYERMIQAWLTRERPFVDPSSLRRFSGDLAVDIFTKRQARNSEKVPPPEALRLALDRGIPLEEWQLRGRSLLNRDAEGNLKFAHRSIMEYLFAEEFIANPACATNRCWTDQIKKFWWEGVTREYRRILDCGLSVQSMQTLQSQIDQARDIGDLSLSRIFRYLLWSLSAERNENSQISIPLAHSAAKIPSFTRN